MALAAWSSYEGGAFSRHFAYVHKQAYSGTIPHTAIGLSVTLNFEIHS